MRLLARLGLALCGLASPPRPWSRRTNPWHHPPAMRPCRGLRRWPAITIKVSLAGGIVSNASGHGPRSMTGWTFPRRPRRLPRLRWPEPVFIITAKGQPVPFARPGATVSGPVSVVESYPPGHAVVGGPALASNLPPGYAVVGGGEPQMAGADPAPVGVSKAGQTQWNNPRLAKMPPRAGAGSFDPSVQPSSMIPPQTALDNENTTRPHILSHLFGIGGISRHIRERREDQERACARVHCL